MGNNKGKFCCYCCVRLTEENIMIQDGFYFTGQPRYKTIPTLRTKEHVIPSETLKTNKLLKEIILPCCYECNHQKGNSNLPDFIDRLKQMPQTKKTIRKIKNCTKIYEKLVRPEFESVYNKKYI